MERGKGWGNGRKEGRMEGNGNWSGTSVAMRKKGSESARCVGSHSGLFFFFFNPNLPPSSSSPLFSGEDLERSRQPDYATLLKELDSVSWMVAEEDEDEDEEVVVADNIRQLGVFFLCLVISKNLFFSFFEMPH